MMPRTFICVLTTIVLLAAQLPASRAAEKVTVTMKVTAKGLQVSGVAMQDKRMTISRGTRVRLVMEYADSNRNAHKFTLTAKNTEITSPVLDGDARKTTAIEFTAGDRGQEFYRLSCELPCIAMDDLVDYIIMVGPPHTAA